MNEMNALVKLGAELDPPIGRPSPDLRRRVMAVTGRRRRLPLPRLGLKVALAGGLAVAVTGGVLVAQVTSLPGRSPASTAQAAEILRGAATQARSRPAHEVRGDEYVYVESVATGGSMKANGEGGVVMATRQRRIWLSVDGTHDGLLQERQQGSSGAWASSPLPGCREGVQEERKGDQVGRTTCTPVPGYRSDLPTTPKAMLTYLRSQPATKNGPDQDAFTAAADLIREADLSPRVLGALFDAVGQIPGVRKVGTVIDAAGRTGVAVSRAEVQGTVLELIFNSVTHQYLGQRTVVRRDQDGLRAGDVLDSSALLRVAVVPAAGQLP